MSSQLVTPNSEAEIWARLIGDQGGNLSLEAADYPLSFAFGETDQERMHRLAGRSEAGALTAEEQREFDSYLQVENSWR